MNQCRTVVMPDHTQSLHDSTDLSMNTQTDKILVLLNFLQDFHEKTLSCKVRRVIIPDTMAKAGRLPTRVSSCRVWVYSDLPRRKMVKHIA
jgi:hypothetical protein